MKGSSSDSEGRTAPATSHLKSMISSSSFIPYDPMSFDNTTEEKESQSQSQSHTAAAPTFGTRHAPVDLHDCPSDVFYLLTALYDGL